MSPQDQGLARLSLVIVWLLTALVSMLAADGMSRDLLRANAIIPTALYPWLIWGGASVDLLLGLWMLIRPGRSVYLSAMFMTLAMTLIGSWVDPALWLHPLGPVSKNLPIIVLLWLLAKES